MAEIDIKTKIPAIVVIIGAILAIVAFFLAWLSTNPEITGLDFVTNKTINSTTMLGDIKVKDIITIWQTMIPLICLIVAIIAAILAVVNFFVEIPKMYLNIIYIVLGLIILILAIVFFMAEGDNFDVASMGHYKFSEHAGIGIWISLVGGIIIAIAGALDLAGVFDKISGGSAQ